MPLNADFFRRLYQGYAAEHHVSSALFRCSYEVFRLPADFGFDLIVTDQFRRALGHPVHHLPFALQVKSRWMAHDTAVVGPNGRREFVIDYRMKVDEVQLVQNTEDSGFVFVFYLGEAAGNRFDVRLIWVHQKQVPTLLDRGYFRANGENYDFTIKYRDFPSFTPATFIAALPAALGQNQGLVEHLQDTLPAEFPRNWNAGAYLLFARLARNNTGALVFRPAWDAAIDFRDFPEQPDIHGLD